MNNKFWISIIGLLGIGAYSYAQNNQKKIEPIEKKYFTINLSNFIDKHLNLKNSHNNFFN